MAHGAARAAQLELNIQYFSEPGKTPVSRPLKELMPAGFIYTNEAVFVPREHLKIIRATANKLKSDEIVWDNSLFALLRMGGKLGLALMLTGRLRKGMVIPYTGESCVLDILESHPDIFKTGYEIALTLPSKRGTRRYFYLDAMRQGNIARFVQHAPSREELERDYVPLNRRVIATANLAMGLFEIEETGQRYFGLQALADMNGSCSPILLSYSYGQAYWNSLNQEPQLFNTAGQAIDTCSYILRPPHALSISRLSIRTANKYDLYRTHGALRLEGRVFPLEAVSGFEKILPPTGLNFFEDGVRIKIRRDSIIVARKDLPEEYVALDNIDFAKEAEKILNFVVRDDKKDLASLVLSIVKKLKQNDDFREALKDYTTIHLYRELLELTVKGIACNLYIHGFEEKAVRCLQKLKGLLERGIRSLLENADSSLPVANILMQAADAGMQPSPSPAGGAGAASSTPSD